MRTRPITGRMRTHPILQQFPCNGLCHTSTKYVHIETKTFSTIRLQIRGTCFLLAGHSLNSSWLNSDSGLCGACHGVGFQVSTEVRQRVAGRSSSLNTEDLWLFSQVIALRHPATDVSDVKMRKALAKQCRFHRHSCIYPINLCFSVITNLWLG